MQPDTPLNQLLAEMLAIASPTYQEQAFVAWCRQRLQKSLPAWQQLEHQDSLIFQSPWRVGLPHLALVGHSDVVPAHFVPHFEGPLLYGAGASDMKGALAAFVHLLETQAEALLARYNLSLLIYSREEQTPLHENGLYHLLQAYPDYFSSLDLAIIGEPTDNTLQLGCVGSLHLKVTVKGLACHSARPWNGENALYKALPFLQKMASLQPVKHEVFGVDFYDVIQVTESQSQPGRTSLPGWWQANVNYRFAPVRSLEQAQAELLEWVGAAGIPPEQTEWLDAVPAGAVIESPLFQHLVAALNVPIEAKQAWTDVAQLTAQGIAAFNYGPGLTAQAHKDHEYINCQMLEAYFQRLLKALSA